MVKKQCGSLCNLLSSLQFHVIDDIWSLERHAVSEGQNIWFEKKQQHFASSQPHLMH